MSGSGEDGPYGKATALLMWFAWIFGFGGIHRLYLGKPVTGIIYLLTWGLLGVGQVIDLVNMNQLVARANARALPAGPKPARAIDARPAAKQLTADPKELMRLKLLDAATKNGGRLTVTQGVMATGQGFKVVEKMLDEMAASGYVGIDNDPDSGAVVYVFNQL